ncbi:MAG: hypothetical protein M1442_00210 [Candidatus Thermoplasmatota archaeon]|nr:hypothetical protein [Candidatus Thermoplasmatota archaeon]
MAAMEEAYAEGVIQGIEASVFVMRSDEPDKIAQLEGICSRLRPGLVREFLWRNEVPTRIPEKEQKEESAGPS